MAEEKEIGVISHYYNHLEVGIIELIDELKLGDTVHIKGAHDDKTITAEALQMEHKDVDTAKSGDSVGIKVPQKVHERDKVYKVIG